MAKLRVGRPPANVDWQQALRFAGMGMEHAEIAKALKIALPTWMRYLQEGDRREQVQIARSLNIAKTLDSMYRAAKAGKVGAASFLLNRLERKL